jgi:hypothetical protein
VPLGSHSGDGNRGGLEGRVVNFTVRTLRTRNRQQRGKAPWFGVRLASALELGAELPAHVNLRPLTRREVLYTKAEQEPAHGSPIDVPTCIGPVSEPTRGTQPAAWDANIPRQDGRVSTKV